MAQAFEAVEATIRLHGFDQTIKALVAKHLVITDEQMEAAVRDAIARVSVGEAIRAEVERHLEKLIKDAVQQAFFSEAVRQYTKTIGERVGASVARLDGKVG